MTRGETKSEKGKWWFGCWKRGIEVDSMGSEVEEIDNGEWKQRRQAGRR